MGLPPEINDRDEIERLISRIEELEAEIHNLQKERDGYKYEWDEADAENARLRKVRGILEGIIHHVRGRLEDIRSPDMDTNLKVAEARRDMLDALFQARAALEEAE